MQHRHEENTQRQQQVSEPDQDGRRPEGAYPQVPEEAGGCDKRPGGQLLVGDTRAHREGTRSGQAVNWMKIAGLLLGLLVGVVSFVVGAVLDVGSSFPKELREQAERERHEEWARKLREDEEERIRRWSVADHRKRKKP